MQNSGHFIDIVIEYLQKLTKTTLQGDSREESYYNHLSELFEKAANLMGKSKFVVTTLPKKTEAGNPDFRLWDGHQHIIGYAEAKYPDKNLDLIEPTDQLKRYRETFPNLLLTNFYEFRLYRDGSLIKRVEIARQAIVKEFHKSPPAQNESSFYDLLDMFFSFSLPRAFKASSLAEELAKRTRFLKEQVVEEELKQETESKGDIYGFYEAFQKYLIPGLTIENFADLYSQTITYGLFTARTRANEDFNREIAYKYIPSTIGILRDVFRFISLGKIPQQMQVIIDDIAEVLHVSDINMILHQFQKEGKGKDPIIHFYETFLSKYDPDVRVQRGVYYTPEPVVSYIVKSINHLLKTKFRLNEGLANQNVTLLDPAGGTLTFPAEAIKIAVAEFKKKYGEGGIKSFIKTHILKNYYAFELMMAPYAIGHLKIGFILEELGYRLEDDERFQLYLTNTLEMEKIEQINVPGLSSLSEESHLAGKIKNDEPLMVILGNPPYFGMSTNSNPWTEKLLKQNLDGAQSYYQVDGGKLNEKNPKWLQDDYVKFLRFAQWKIQKAGKGIVGMITNHRYLNNPTFRGMRQSLLNTFNEIYILDLNGYSQNQEKTPSGERDENVFDIQQGVAITLFVKNSTKDECRIYHSDLYGTREKKYDWLSKTKFSAKNYKLIHPESPDYFFVPRNTEKIKHYLKWNKISEIFSASSVGIVTARDKLTIQYTKPEVMNTIMHFSQIEPDMARLSYQLGDDTREWKIQLAQKDLKDSGLDKEKIVPIQYRPFDIRYTYYTGNSKGFHCRPRSSIMRHMLAGYNIGLLCVRQVKTGESWQHCTVTRKIVESCCISNKTSEIGYLFPLYSYNDKSDKRTKSHLMLLFEPEEDYERKTPNFDSKIYNELQQVYRGKITPEKLFYYIYAILYCNVYRIKYAEFLKVDFPRIPFVRDFKLFQKLADEGETLAKLHVLDTNSLMKTITRYEGSSDNDVIEQIEYKADKQRVYINSDKYFTGVSAEMWNYQIGGYHVLQKYLKDRKNTVLREPKHYCQIAAAISKTIVIQQEIDAIYPMIEGDLIY